jgi:hypothetical protein
MHQHAPKNNAPAPDAIPPATSGGARVLKRIFERRIGRELSPRQALDLWGEVRLHLQKKGLRRTVREAITSSDGSLDTLPRDDVLEAIAQVVTGVSWPCNWDGAQASRRFSELMTAGLDARGYARAADTADPRTRRKNGAPARSAKP